MYYIARGKAGRDWSINGPSKVSMDSEVVCTKSLSFTHNDWTVCFLDPKISVNDDITMPSLDCNQMKYFAYTFIYNNPTLIINV